MLSKHCLKAYGHMERCIGYGYNPKDQSCKDGVKLGKKCVKSHAAKCKQMGWKSKKNKCKRGGGEKCAKKCKSCDACAKQSKECQQKIKYCRKNCAYIGK